MAWYDDKNFYNVTSLKLKNGNNYDLSVATTFYQQCVLGESPMGYYYINPLSKFIQLTIQEVADNSGSTRPIGHLNPYTNPDKITTIELANGYTLGFMTMGEYRDTDRKGVCLGYWSTMIVKKPNDDTWYSGWDFSNPISRTAPRFLDNINWGKIGDSINEGGANVPQGQGVRFWIDPVNELAWILGITYFPVYPNSSTGECWQVGDEFFSSYDDSPPPACSHNLYLILKDATNIDYGNTDPYKEDASDDGGGDRDSAMTSEPIEIPSLPQISATSTGFITLYNPNLQQLNQLASYMWTTDFFDNIIKLWADPMDVILNLSILPVDIPNGAMKSIKVGNIDTGISMYTVDNQFYELDCGSITIGKKWGSYLDFSPYTKIQLYLPYIGVHSLDVDEVMGKTVNVVYHIDILTGSLVCYVKANDSVLYTFGGQCGVSVPVTSANYSQAIMGALTVASSVGFTVASGGLSAPIALSHTANIASTVASSKPQVEKSGALSGSVGFMSIPRPYLIISRPRVCIPQNQNKYSGYPSHTLRKIKDVSGFTTFGELRLSNIKCTDEELRELESILKGGCIL